jgi:signal peptidase I
MKKRWLWILSSFLVLLIAGFVFFRLFQLPETNMEKSIGQKSWVVVQKAAYTLNNPFNRKPFIHISKPQTNDLICFYLPIKSDLKIHKKPVRVSRLVGTPGDSIFVYQGMVFINRKRMEEPPGMQKKYRLYSETDLFKSGFMERYGVTNWEKILNTGLYDLSLTKKGAEQISNDSLVSHVRIVKETNPTGRLAFPESPYFSYTNDFYGPLRIPFKGLSIRIDYRNIDLYSRIISLYEGNTLENRAGRIFINHIETEYYTFTGNYYFVLDDNRDYGSDSRKWGFLPEDHLIGRVIYY